MDFCSGIVGFDALIACGEYRARMRCIR